jgi:Flp pilus assembly pilin Flp
MVKVSRKIMGRLVKDRKGASAVEYAILVGCIGAVLSVGATGFGNGLSDKLNGLLNTIDFGN